MGKNSLKLSFSSVVLCGPLTKVKEVKKSVKQIEESEQQSKSETSADEKFSELSGDYLDDFDLDLDSDSDSENSD